MVVQDVPASSEKHKQLGHATPTPLLLESNAAHFTLPLFDERGWREHEHAPDQAARD
jgi:hypothetical protein